MGPPRRFDAGCRQLKLSLDRDGPNPGIEFRGGNILTFRVVAPSRASTLRVHLGSAGGQEHVAVPCGFRQTHDRISIAQTTVRPERVDCKAGGRVRRMAAVETGPVDGKGGGGIKRR